MELMASIIEQIENSEPLDVLLVIGHVITVVMTVAGLISACVILYGGVLVSVSAGDSSKVSRGKSCILGGVIGLAISMVAFAIIRFVIAAL